MKNEELIEFAKEQISFHEARTEVNNVEMSKSKVVADEGTKKRENKESQHMLELMKKALENLEAKKPEPKPPEPVAQPPIFEIEGKTLAEIDKIMKHEDETAPVMEQIIPMNRGSNYKAGKAADNTKAD